MYTDALQGKGERSWEGHGKEAAREEEEIKDNNIRAFLWVAVYNNYTSYLFIKTCSKRGMKMKLILCAFDYETSRIVLDLYDWS